jgi:hypothetical protein
MAPDIYVLPGVSQDIAISTWKVWEHDGIVPSLVIEIVCGNPHKDYEDSPQRCAELGVQELIVFDPFPGTDRIRFQVYRQDHGRFVLAERTNADRVPSRVLGAFLRVVGQDARMRLRVATGSAGELLLPTADEAEKAEKAAKEAEKAAKEVEKAAKEVEKAAKETERAAKEAALRRVAELEMKLRKDE